MPHADRSSKSRPWAALEFKFDFADQAAIMAGFDFRSSALELRLVRPAAVPSRVPTQSWPADHARWSHHHDRRWRHHNRRRLNHDDPPVQIATTIRATMRAPATTFRGLSAEACEAQHGGECRYRQDLSGHLLGYPPFFSVKS
jgi:hypothetical protein